ncbi:MAG: ankyrin repeat domain-containing protein [Endomicrobium sp.]|nr:ankyrin repeat domain-containing protein [Endomicrobium sp.]
MRLVFFGARLNIKKARGVLSSAIGVEDIDTIEKLIKNGARINMKNSNYVPPILMAINRDNYEIVELLIQKRVNLDAKDGEGNTVLDYTRRYDGKELMEFLLKKGIFTKNKVRKMF